MNSHEPATVSQQAALTGLRAAKKRHEAGQTGGDELRVEMNKTHYLQVLHCQRINQYSSF